MDLAADAEVSTRHVSFIENNRSQPSREMVLILASVLDLPLRERNVLLLAAGYAPAYRETNINAPQAAQIRRALEFLLAQSHPNPALVVDGAWNIVMSNNASQRLTQSLAHDLAAISAAGPPNLLRLLCHPAGLRRSILNWGEVIHATLARARRELSEHGQNSPLAAIMSEVMAYPEMPITVPIDAFEPSQLLIPIHLAVGHHKLRMFTTITTLGTAQDVTLQELRIESFFPADRETEAAQAVLLASA